MRILGIEKGDIITEVDNTAVTCTNDLTSQINKSNGNDMQITYIRDGNEQIATLKAIKSNDNTYKIGLWVRDTAAGVGTATFYEPETKRFAGLGHGIVDSDTEELVEIASRRSRRCKCFISFKRNRRKSTVKYRVQ